MAPRKISEKHPSAKHLQRPLKSDSDPKQKVVRLDDYRKASEQKLRVKTPAERLREDRPLILQAIKEAVDTSREARKDRISQLLGECAPKAKNQTEKALLNYFRSMTTTETQILSSWLVFHVKIVDGFKPSPEHTALVEALEHYDKEAT
ncbi:MAG: hypothetical protein IH613_02720 [Desulfuromonadales bacterium]|nr:hypothetical protein [Desulfuromonadales bacterium]